MSPSKRKGTAYERELVHAINDHPDLQGVWAERAYGSNGKALGKSEECDLVITRAKPGRLEFEMDEFTVQAKRRKAIAQYMKPPKDVDITMIREDRGDTLVVMNLDLFISILRKWQQDAT